jgi:uncharacterized membrane protein YjfL (UPF0719 family)
MDAKTIGFVVLSVILLLVLARFIHQLIFGKSITEMLIDADNPAVALALGGFMLGVVQVIIPILSGGSHSFWRDVAGVAAYGIGGILAMAVTGLLFGYYSQWIGLNLREQVKAGNVAAGLITAAEYLAASFLVSGTLTGDSGAILPTVVFWLAGIIALVVITHVFRQLTDYDDVAQITQRNVAAAAGYAGLLIANGMMVGFAVSGDFTGYQQGFRGFGLMLLVVLAFYPVRQFIVQTVLLGGAFSLRGGRLDREIADDQNLGAGLLEAIGYISTAMIVTHIL